MSQLLAYFCKGVPDGCHKLPRQLWAQILCLIDPCVPWWNILVMPLWSLSTLSWVRNGNPGCHTSYFRFPCHIQLCTHPCAYRTCCSCASDIDWEGCLSPPPYPSFATSENLTDMGPVLEGWHPVPHQQQIHISCVQSLVFDPWDVMSAILVSFLNMASLEIHKMWAWIWPRPGANSYRIQ
jgi:hypothetical protein